MRIVVFSTRPHDREFLSAANGAGYELVFLEAHLNASTAVLAGEGDIVCAFVNDDLSRPVLEQLASRGVRGIALRSAGFNHVDVDAARTLGLTVARVPAYSPHAVAEHTVALMLTLNRYTHRAYNRVREGNFSIDGMLGFDMAGKCVGIVGTGIIGAAVASILHGFGCRIIAVDSYVNPKLEALGASYASLEEMLPQADIVTLHCPLTPDTFHLIDEAAVGRMRRGAMLINTSRGAVVDASALVEGIKIGQLGYVGMDVYEEEEAVFFEDLSMTVIQDDVLARLMTFPNVLITAHQAFFTREALTSIAQTTFLNADALAAGGSPPAENLVKA